MAKEYKLLPLEIPDVAGNAHRLISFNAAVPRILNDIPEVYFKLRGNPEYDAFYADQEEYEDERGVEFAKAWFALRNKEFVLYDMEQNLVAANPYKL